MFNKKKNKQAEAPIETTPADMVGAVEITSAANTFHLSVHAAYNNYQFPAAIDVVRTRWIEAREIGEDHRIEVKTHMTALSTSTIVVSFSL